MVNSLSPSAKEDIQRRIDEAVQAKKVPGLVFGVTSATGELFWAQSGLRKVNGPDGGPITPDSVLMICSQTKMITAIATLQLIEAGELTLDTPGADLLPELANPVVIDEATGAYHPASNPILMRHLLSHTSGLSYGDEPKKTGLTPSAYFTSNLAVDSSMSRAEITKAWIQVLKGDLPGLPLKFEPGTSWQYVYSIDFLGFIVETLSGQSLEEFCKSKIFEPLVMSSTSFYLTPDLEKKYVDLAVKTPGGETVPYSGQFPIVECDPKKPREYLTLERHLLQRLDGTAEKPILNAEYHKLMFEPSLSPECSKGMDNFFSGFAPPGQQHGLGLGVQAADKGPDRRKKGTCYWSGWAGTSHYIDPQTGIAVYAGSHLVRPPQIPVIMLLEELEPIVYKGLNQQRLSSIP